MMTELERERLVRENLAARLGALIAENIELLLRINDLEKAAQTDTDRWAAELAGDHT